MTESSVLAALARAEYDAMTDEERADVDARWAARSEEEREALRLEIEMDLL